MNEHSVQPSKNNTMITGIAVFAVIAALTAGVVMLQKRSDATAETTAPVTVTTEATAQPATSPQENQEFKDGTYTVVGQYTSPGGPEEIGVKVTLLDNAIKDVVVEPKATIPASQKFQKIFSENYKQLVVGKNINEVTLDKVAGSSLTPKGFNDALQKVMTEARS